MAGHFLAFENLARILTLASRTMRPVRNGHTVRGTQTAKIVALHTTGKTLTNGRARDIHFLTADVMFGRKFCAHINHVVFSNPELGQLALGLNIRFGKMAAHGFCHALDLGRASTQLNSRVAILVSGPLGDDLTIVNLHDSNRNIRPVFTVNPCHAQLFSNYARAHRISSLKRPA